MIRRRRFDAGMTLTELMVSLVIVGVLAAASRPMFSRDRTKREGREFAHQLARDLQRLRFTAIAERLPQRAFVFSDRVELRSGVAGADVNDPPRVPELTDPTQRVLTADPDISVWEVRHVAGVPSSPQLSTATHRVIQFNTTGQASVQGVSATSITIFIRNAHPGAGTQERNFRIDISPLTGHVSLVETW